MPKAHCARALRPVALFTLIVMALAAGTANTAALAPSWTRDFVRPISWQRMTALGQLLVSTPGALFAIDPESGEPIWTLPGLGELGAVEVQEIAGTPLVLLEAEGLEDRVVIVNTFTGALVFDSSAERLTKIASTHVLPRSGRLLIAGFESGKPQPTLFLYGMGDGRRFWQSDALHAGMGGFMSLMLSAALVMTDATPVQSAPLELDDGSFILGAMGNLYRFDGETGELVWKTPFAGGRFELRQAPERPGVIYAGAEEIETSTGSDGSTQRRAQTSFQGFALADGRALWKRPVSFGTPMNDLVITDRRGLIVSEGDSGKGRLRLLDYDTGTGLWGKKGKGLDLKGQVLDHAYLDGDVVLTTGYDSIWTNKDTAYLLYVLDPAAGALRFEKPFEVRGRMLRTERHEKGLLYVTTHEVNVFDPASGALLNEPVLRSKQPIVTADDGSVIYAFNAGDGFIYQLDRADAGITRFSQAPLEFQAGDEPRSLERIDDALVLLGGQSVAGFAADGSLRFTVHYRAPRDPAWLRSLAWAEGIRAGMASAYAGAISAAAASAAADASQGSAGHEVASELQRGFGELQQGYAGLASDYVSFARRRYEASAASRDFAFMMVQDEDRRVLLAQVSKRDGRIIASIDLARDKEPDYQVDDISSAVFYRPESSMIAAYHFAAE